MTPDEIVELFREFGPVTVRRMFGGAGIFTDGTMLGLVADGRIYLKAGAGNAAAFEREELPPFTFFMPRKNKRVVTSYRRMPDRLYDDPEELAIWARNALAAAREPKVRGKRAGSAAKAAKPAKARKR